MYDTSVRTKFRLAVGFLAGAKSRAEPWRQQERTYVRTYVRSFRLTSDCWIFARLGIRPKHSGWNNNVPGTYRHVRSFRLTVGFFAGARNRTGTRLHVYSFVRIRVFFSTPTLELLTLFCRSYQSLQRKSPVPVNLLWH